MISVIIPTYNEENSIQSTISYVFTHACYKKLIQEVIVVDGGSTDRTINEARKAGATVIICPKNDRSCQMNYGAQFATGKILYFLPANLLPPTNFTKEIVRAFQKGYACGSFTVAFDYKHWMLNFLSWCTRMKKPFIHLSDQSLFVTKELFHKAGEFREDHVLMAFHEIINRLKRYSNFIVMRDNILASAKNYIKFGIGKLEIVKTIVFFMYIAGYPQRQLMKIYDIILKRKKRTSILTEEIVTHEAVPATQGADLS